MKAIRRECKNVIFTHIFSQTEGSDSLYLQIISYDSIYLWFPKKKGGGRSSYPSLSKSKSCLEGEGGDRLLCSAILNCSRLPVFPLTLHGSLKQFSLPTAELQPLALEIQRCFFPRQPRPRIFRALTRLAVYKVQEMLRWTFIMDSVLCIVFVSKGRLTLPMLGLLLGYVC